MDKDNPDISVNITYETEAGDDDAESFERLVHYILNEHNVQKADVSITVVNDAKITEVNKQFLDHSYVTDVISFDLSDEDDDCKTYDIVINYEQAQRQAQERSHSITAELALYITHGLLHNLGYDDGTDDDSRQMHQAEDRILQNAGFGTVYGNNDFDGISKG